MNAIAELLSDFEVLDDWEDRYKHVIELGRELPPLPEADQAPRTRSGAAPARCGSPPQPEGPPDNPVLTFQGDSDALIVKGLIAIAFMIYSGSRRARSSRPMRARSSASSGFRAISPSSAPTASPR